MDPRSRTAEHARADADLLDALAAAHAEGLAVEQDGAVRVAELAAIEDALRRRVWRLLARRAAEPGTPDPTSVHLGELDRLVTDWRGQGPVDLPGGGRWARWRGVGGDPVVGPIGKNGAPPASAED